MVDVRIGRIDITQRQLRARVFGGRERFADAERPPGPVRRPLPPPLLSPRVASKVRPQASWPPSVSTFVWALAPNALHDAPGACRTQAAHAHQAACPGVTRWLNPRPQPKGPPRPY